MRPNETHPRSLIFLAALVATFLVGVRASAAEPAAQASVPKPAPAVKFRPPTTSAPTVRVTGGSRGTGESLVTLDVLAPDDVGLTTREQPSLFWFQSKPVDAKFELTVIQENKVKPLLQVMLPSASKSGIQRLNLSEHGAKLVPGVEYQWVVALISDADNRSKDLVASGAIKRIEPSEALKSGVSKSSPASRAALYADAGVWYDTLASLSDEIESQPKDLALRQARAELLRQVGLKAVAAAEESR